MQFNFISLSALGLLASSLAAQHDVKRATSTLAADCKRSFRNVPNTQLQTTSISPQPIIGAGVGGAGGKNGTTPVIVAGGVGSSQASGIGSSSLASSTTNEGGLIEIQWTMGAFAAAAGVVAML